MVTVNLTAALSGVLGTTGVISLKLRASPGVATSSYFVFNSRENVENRPKLLVGY
jgi:hypothetical protein